MCSADDVGLLVLAFEMENIDGEDTVFKVVAYLDGRILKHPPDTTILIVP